MSEHGGQSMFDMLGNLSSMGYNFESFAQNIGNAQIAQMIFPIASLMAGANYTGSLLDHPMTHAPVDKLLKGLFQNPSVMSLFSPESFGIFSSIAGKNKGKEH